MRTSDWPDVLTPAAFHILVALSDANRHGIGIMREVERYTGGAIHLGPGTLYGTIKKLRDAGFISSGEPPVGAETADPRNRYYRVTAEGRAALRRHAEHLQSILAVARAKGGLTPGKAS